MGDTDQRLPAHVPGHYDGEPFDVAVFRPSEGLWFVKDRPVIPYGAKGDVPLSRPIGAQ